jgi:enoyl-CoA hydratase/carnithine racemase
MGGNMTDPVLRQDAGDGVIRLTLNAPASLNALSVGMLDALQQQLDRLESDPSARVVILNGAGRAFCAGHDLKEMTTARGDADGGERYFDDLFARAARLMESITRLPQPVIAEVHGVATAAGCQLVASCDLAVADEGTRFGVNGVNLGLFCSTPMVALTRNVPRKLAFELLATGRFLDAGEAQRYGLVNRVVPKERLAATAADIAATIAAKLPTAIRIGKRAFYDQIDLPTREAYQATCRAMTLNALDSGTASAIADFLDRGKRAAAE